MVAAGVVVVVLVVVGAAAPQPEFVLVEPLPEPPIPTTLPTAPRTETGAPTTVFRVPVAIASASGTTWGLAIVPPTIMGMARLVRLVEVAKGTRCMSSPSVARLIVPLPTMVAPLVSVTSCRVVAMPREMS